MKVAVLNNCVPFLFGGAEYLAQALTQKLAEYGHEALLVRIPFRWEPPRKILESMVACRLMRLPNVDRVVALKFPAYYVPHDGKLLWLLHQFRQVYDLWGTSFQGLPSNSEGQQIRHSVMAADNIYLRQALGIFTNSHVTSERLRKFNGIESTVLYPPLRDPRSLFCEDYGDYVFCPGRITASKRQRLAVEAMQYVTSDVRLVVAGSAEAPTDLAGIHHIIREYRLERRVQVIPRFISEQEKAMFFGRALACIYLPYDEDSYGYVTLEAYTAKKPVITCLDSGGISILVKDGRTGFVVEPHATAVAEAMDRLYTQRAAARQMGEAGWDLVQSLQITWDHVIKTLTR